MMKKITILVASLLATISFGQSITNGTFDTDLSGWTFNPDNANTENPIGNTWTHTSGKAMLTTGKGTAVDDIVQTVSGFAGDESTIYTFKFTISNYVPSGSKVGQFFLTSGATTNGNSSGNPKNITATELQFEADGTYEVEVTTDATDVVIEFGKNNSNVSYRLDDVSVVNSPILSTTSLKLNTLKSEVIAVYTIGGKFIGTSIKAIEGLNGLFIAKHANGATSKISQ